MTKTSRRRYRAYFMFSDGHSVPIRAPGVKGMTTYKTARRIAGRTKGCTTVGFFPKGAHHITTVWSKPSCPTKVRRKAARGG